MKMESAILIINPQYLVGLYIDRFCGELTDRHVLVFIHRTHRISDHVLRRFQSQNEQDLEKLYNARINPPEMYKKTTLD